ncbi:flavin reductase family protein [Streptomyces anulatus]|uniref:flavin reductase family protein n=1 Tax=Streptomyces anulatus TaxID=1892 RepID=UPI0006D95EA5|nr:flavin reductase family protein [Streptomyces anulatus]MDF9807599.1 flavin reductase (DIM6/NTAB) family NADH-FMN oxidoreductase RutF [Streptomyces sp. HB372]KPL29487.1 flavin reductase [Streptomyces anulatus]WSC64977.1 flavin reductase family protein [Streptomyces anulatus]WTC62283.1 flavin reductase family protein [Streptomyces anulatus]WUC85782.1 flavin reductase family protein [Streptomyces anulatus]
MLTITVPSYAPVYAPDRFKQVFRRYPAGVVVVTADSGRGPVGFTATSLTSLSLDPPLVSYGIGVAASSWPHVEAAASTVVNFLGADQESLARTFATSGIDRFAAPTAWRRLPEGEPVLDGVAGWLRLETERIVPAGDHRIVIARVTDSWLDEDRAPLLFHDGAYHSL